MRQLRETVPHLDAPPGVRGIDRAGGEAPEARTIMRSAMKPHELITPWKGDKRYTDIARRAAALKKAGANAEQIVAALTAEFGAPAQLLGLRDVPAPAHVFGTVGDKDTPAGGADIEPGAYAQLQLALRLPIAIQGALLPDAHQGYALPIGGVFRSYNSVAPAMVGVDIACRMMLTIFVAPPEEVRQRRDELFSLLKRVTTFGAGVARAYAADHAVLEDARWGATNQLRERQSLHAGGRAGDQADRARPALLRVARSR